MKILLHRFNKSCIVKNPDCTLRCLKSDNIRVSKDNTRNRFILLPDDYSAECLWILQCVGFTYKIDIDDEKHLI